MTDNESDNTPSETKRSPISLTFLIIVAVLGVGGYLAGPYIMSQVFLVQERMKANAEPTKNELDDTSARPSLGQASAGGSPPPAEPEEPEETEASSGGGGAGTPLE